MGIIKIAKKARHEDILEGYVRGWFIMDTGHHDQIQG